jgi:hypothetical protein
MESILPTRKLEQHLQHLVDEGWTVDSVSFAINGEWVHYLIHCHIEEEG